MSQSLAASADQLIHWFEPHQRYAIALSGGVDSSVVAAAASRSSALAIAVTARSPSVAQRERDDVERLLQCVSIEHHWLDTNETASADYQRNDLRRCYFCKSHLFSAIRLRFPDHQIVTGTNADDLSDYRPGLVAAQESTVLAPLADLGFRKSLVRELARHWNLPLADKPASPCLASRVAYGVSVTDQRLRMVEQAEEYLRSTFGLSEFRVRVHAGELARIEVPVESLVQLLVPENRVALTQHFLQLGFHFVTLDLIGFRSGSLNQLVNLTT